VAESSGHERLDQDALNTVLKASAEFPSKYLARLLNYRLDLCCAKKKIEIWREFLTNFDKFILKFEARFVSFKQYYKTSKIWLYYR